MVASPAFNAHNKLCMRVLVRVLVYSCGYSPKLGLNTRWVHAMYVYMYVLYIRMHACIHVWMQACMRCVNTYMYVWMHACIYMYPMYLWMRACMYIWMHECHICMNASMHVAMYVLIQHLHAHRSSNNVKPICRHDNVSNAEIMDSGDRTAFTKATAYICALIVISYVGPDADWLLSYGCAT